MPSSALQPAGQQASDTKALGLRLRGVQKVFDGRVEAVAALDLDIAAGEFLAMLGPSGCGKSTLLRMIAGLEEPTGGTIAHGHDKSREVDGKGSMLGPGVSVGYVFQDAHLLPWRRVLENVMLPLELQQQNAGDAKSRHNRRERATQVLEQVGLQDALERYPAQLSGGMKMRVSLARALVLEPALLLLDEPFAALDEITRQGLDEQLRELWLRQQMTVVFVTHAIHEATFLAQRAVVLSRRPARVVLDHRIDLPVQRDGLMRTTPEFARQTRVLYEALVRGEALT